MGLLSNFQSMTSEEIDFLGKASTRVQDAGIHKLTIVKFYETNTEYPQVVIEFKSEDGLDITYREFQLTSVWDEEAKKYKDEKITDKYVAGYIYNIGKAVFGDKFDMLKQLGKGAKANTITTKAGKVINITEFPNMIGKVIGQGTFTEFSSEDKKIGKLVFRNQAIDIRAIYTKDFVSIPEQKEGLTIGKNYITTGEKLKETFKPAQGYKDISIVKKAIRLAKGRAGITVTEEAPELSESIEDLF